MPSTLASSRKEDVDVEGDAANASRASNARTQLLDQLPVTERRLEVAGISTPVLEGGDGPPVVLLHGIGSFALEWSLVIKRLVATNRVVAPDLPGLGDSDARRHRLDSPTLVNWLPELIDLTCVEAPTVVGHSMGGGVAARFAVQHGERLRRLVLVDASSLGAFRPAIAVIVALVQFGARPSAKNRERFLRQVLADPARARLAWGDRWSALEAYDLQQAADKNVSAANGQLVRRVGSRRIPQAQLGTIDVPVSLVWGTGDRLMRLRIAERASSRFGWPLFPISCGHGPQIEQPDRFGDVLRGAMGG